MSELNKLPPSFNFDSVRILRKSNEANKALAELKGYSDVIPNKNILLNAITINEAKESSEIENIITTHDELYRALSTSKATKEAKEVVNYRSALWHGYEFVKKNGYITTNLIVEIQKIIEENDAGIRRTPGTVLENEQTKEVVYKPPSGYDNLRDYMSNLEKYINNNDLTYDPLIQMAITHYQFESIHPFYDGNGRTGRILNILHLILKGLLDTPILYLSSYINSNKSDYYLGLQNVGKTNDWEEWIIYILEGVRITSINTLNILKDIMDLIENTSKLIKEKLPKLYSKELVDAIFIEFYTKINFIEDALGVTRKTASQYLVELENLGVLKSEKVGRSKVYLNIELYKLIQDAKF